MSVQFVTLLAIIGSRVYQVFYEHKEMNKLHSCLGDESSYRARQSVYRPAGPCCGYVVPGVCLGTGQVDYSFPAQLQD